MEDFTPSPQERSRYLGKLKKTYSGVSRKRMIPMHRHKDNKESKYEYCHELPRKMSREEAREWLLKNKRDLKESIGRKNMEELVEYFE